MRKVSHYLLTGTLALFALSIHADELEQVTQPTTPLASNATSVPLKPFSPFTGKVTRNKVRLRLQPNLEGPILRELAKDELLVIVNEAGEFYVAQPKMDLKGYIFRTYVLDNIVEGNRVNVRLEPSTEAPIVMQLNSGDRVDGSISTQNSKWLEIPLPKDTTFYICKDYVEKIGDSSVMERISKRRQEVNQLLESTESISLVELEKPFQQINLAGITENLKKIINGHSDLPVQTDKAKALLDTIQDKYLAKKIAFLESKNQIVSEIAFQPAQQQAPIEIVQIPQENPDNNLISLAEVQKAIWAPAEQTLYTNWLKDHSGKSLEDFYSEQQNEAVTIIGTIEPYDRSVKNKPGDYVVVNKATRIPVAYLYSTLVNLQEKIGQEIEIQAVPRSNNNFAYPAYFAISVE